MINLYKRTHFITETIYTTSSGLVKETVIEIIKSLKEDTDILCENSLYLSEIFHLVDPNFINKTYTNADFTFHPLARDMIKPNQIVLVIGEFENVHKYKKIHQVGFIYNSHVIRMGLKI